MTVTVRDTEIFVETYLADLRSRLSLTGVLEEADAEILLAILDARETPGYTKWERARCSHDRVVRRRMECSARATDYRWCALHDGGRFVAESLVCNQAAGQERWNCTSCGDRFEPIQASPK
jgi:hypothetical protein